MPRPRKPTHLKVLAGNPGKRPVPEEREVAHGPAEKPAWLSVEEGAIWDELAPSRIEIGLLTDKTVDGFATLCQYFALARKSPQLLTGPQITDMRYLRAAFGFEPSGLAKAGIAIGGKPQKQNPYAKFTGS